MKIKKRLDKLPARVKEIISLMGNVSRELNCNVYLVGGFVRDLLLGIPNFDLDIVVEGDGLDFSRKLYEKIPGRLIQHKRFLTATIVTLDKIKIDIASARSEIYPAPASLPVVSFNSIKEDLKRRDFTVNSLAVSIGYKNFGGLIDFTQGQDDLRNKKIRILHDQSFIDDPTRILRAIRFKNRFNFRFENKTLLILKQAVKLRMLFKTQKHRLRDELILILKEGQPIKNIKELNFLCGFKFIHKNLVFSRKQIALLNVAQKRIAWFERQEFRKRKMDDWLVYLICLLDDLKYRQTQEFCLEYALERRDTKRILAYKEFLIKDSSKLNKPIKPVVLFKLLSPLSYETIIAVLTKLKNKNASLNIVNFLANFHTVRVSINGEVIKSLGVKEGPRVREMLKKVHDALINKEIFTKEEQVDFLKKVLKTNS